MYRDKDYFEIYLDKFPDSPSLVLVRSVELKNFPRNFLKPPILDLCCGDGFFAQCLGVKNIYGCDISPQAIQKASNKEIYINLEVCDVKNMPFPDNSFNSVFSNCALEHVEGIEKALKEIRRILRKDGYLIMTVPSDKLYEWFVPGLLFRYFGLEKFMRTLYESYNKKQAHLNIMSFNKWKQLLEQYDLMVVDHYYLFEERGYKIAILLDWLGTLRLYNYILRLFSFLIPINIKKSFWRWMIKRHYLQSKPLIEGGGNLNNSKK